MATKSEEYLRATLATMDDFACQFITGKSDEEIVKQHVLELAQGFYWPTQLVARGWHDQLVDAINHRLLAREPYMSDGPYIAGVYNRIRYPLAKIAFGKVNEKEDKRLERQCR